MILILFLFIYCRVGIFVTSPVANVSSKEWLDYCFSKTSGGKGGGKADTANGNISGGQTVADVLLAAATEFVSAKM